jgi:hypothetical protein
MKRSLAACSAFLVAAVGLALVWLGAPFAEIRDRQLRYDTVSRGMTRAQVIEIMGTPDSERFQPGPQAWWDQERLVDVEPESITSAIRYRTATFYLPVTFEFTFDAEGQIAGKHRYD